jgi:uroporphyrinogen-III decarboxylase
MAIGPFSLMTKLLADPITPLALAASGSAAPGDETVRLAAAALEMALATVLRSVAAQVRAGARAVILCEPAISVTYLSPRQIARAPHVFEQFALHPLRKVRSHLEELGAALILHDCGQLSTSLVRTLAAELRPAMLSLGSSRRLWEDAAVVPPDTVLYGNLPTRQFYSDSAMPVDQVRSLARDLAARMRDTGHPFILGSECDVLHVPEAAETIRRKVEAMLEA